MSLHTLANHLQSAGRGEDKVLVHMTPKEVSSLQTLAMAHGGSLTINPETGLPEAGILSALLPMAAGFFLGPAGAGIAESALGAGAMVGGATALATGSLTKGLMAGFGAYGGYGLGEGLMSAGANAMPGVEMSPIGADAASAADMSRIYGGQGPASWDATGFSGNEIQGAGQAAKDAASNLGAVNQTGAFNAYQPQGLNLSQGPFANLQQQGVDISAANYPDAPTIQTSSAPVYEAPKGILEGGTGTTSTANVSPTGINTAPPTTSTLPAEGTMKVPSKMDQLGAGFKDVTSSGDKAWGFVKEHPGPFIGLGVGALQSYQEQKAEDAANAAKAATGPSYIRPYEFSTEQNASAYAPSTSTAERQFFVNPRYTAKPIQQVKEGGITSLAVGGPVEQMAAQNATGSNTMYPQSQLQTDMYSNPMVQRPMPNDVITAGVDAPVDRYTGEQKMADGGMAGGGYNLGSYSDGGRLLRGPGDGVSDSIPASIGNRQPARLADGEFVVPARIVSEIGNGSTEAGARKLYAMMDRVQKARGKTVGKNKVAVNTKADKLLPA